MLSTTAQHALRALVVLARKAEGESILGRDLAEASDVPANYLSKLLLDLNKAGLVAAVRGTGGGYRLRRGPESISLMEVVRIFDPPRARPGCLLGGGRECRDDAPCPAHAAWRETRAQFLAFLEGTTLADISMEPPGEGGGMEGSPIVGWRGEK